jgi:hypothetical protein
MVRFRSIPRQQTIPLSEVHVQSIDVVQRVAPLAKTISEAVLVKGLPNCDEGRPFDRSLLHRVAGGLQELSR